MNSGRGGPKAFWEREHGSTLGASLPSQAPHSGRPASPSGPPPSPGTVPPPTPYAPGSPQPTGPPARVGGAVAALAVALLTLLGPALGLSLGLTFFLLATNIPGIALGIVALVKIPNAPEVERFIRYTWACNFAYAALTGLLLIPVIAVVLLFAF